MMFVGSMIATTIGPYIAIAVVALVLIAGIVIFLKKMNPLGKLKERRADRKEKRRARREDRKVNRETRKLARKKRRNKLISKLAHQNQTWTTKLFGSKKNKQLKSKGRSQPYKKKREYRKPVRMY